MRPVQLPAISPQTAVTTQFNAQTFTSTGAATAPSTTTTSDGLAHLVTLISPVQATLAGITFTIVGTDANDMAQTETGIVGPASNSTVTSTKHFKTIATVQPSATMGGLVVSIGQAAESVTQMIPLEWRSIAAAAMTVKVTGTVNFTVEETYASPYNNAHEACPWVSITALAAKTATTSSTATVGAQAVRLKTNTVTNGATLTFYITQASTWAV
jgi:hypothetical protein